MSKDKYPSIFSHQMKAIVFIILQIFFATCAILKIGEHPRIFPSIRSRDVFRPIARERKDLMDYNLRYSCNVVQCMGYLPNTLEHSMLSFFPSWRV